MKTLFLTKDDTRKLIMNGMALSGAVDVTIYERCGTLLARRDRVDGGMNERLVEAVTYIDLLTSGDLRMEVRVDFAVQPDLTIKWTVDIII